MLSGFRTLLADPARVLRDPLLAGTLAVNLIPAIGLFAWGWRLETLVVFYWLENLIVGAANLLRILVSGAAHGVGGLLAAAFLGPFFTVHYGMFCFVHGIFVMAMFVQQPEFFGPEGPQVISLVAAALDATPNWPIALGAIVVLKLVYFAVDFLGRGDFRRIKPPDLMMEPYGRIIFMHLSIFAGGFALMSLGSPIWGVALLVAVKTVFDLAADAVERTGVKPAPASLKRA
jgi:hypothetical protein